MCIRVYIPSTAFHTLFNMLDPFFQDNNGVIGLLEPLKTCTVPVKVPMPEPVVKIASGKNESASLPHVFVFQCFCFTSDNVSFDLSQFL